MNFLLEVIYLVLSILGIIFIIPSIGFKFYLFLPIIIILLLLIIFLANFFVKKIISKEYTLSTKILKNINENIQMIEFIKESNLEKETLAKIDQIVNIDTHFKIKRNIHMNIGRRILFALITVGFIIFNIYSFFFAERSYELEKIITYSIFSAVFIRLLYSSLNIGLYYFPFKLGLILSIRQKSRFKLQKLENFSKIIFKSRKTKLKNSGKYYKKINFEISPNKKVFIENKDLEENWNLARILTGFETELTKSWVIKQDNIRYFYKYWSSIQTNLYLLSLKNFDNLSIAEIITGKTSENIYQKDIEKISEIINSNKFFKDILKFKNSFASIYDQRNYSIEQNILLQIAHLIFTENKIVVIDPYLSKLKIN